MFSTSPRSRLPLALLATVLVGTVALAPSCSCDDDDDPTPMTTPDNNDMMGDTGDNNGDDANNANNVNNAGDAGDTGMDVPPDLPEPTNDEERILFIPETESWVFPELEGEVHVVRTEGSIPHVFAESRDDLAYVLGFIVAKDRYFLMDLQRRLAKGTISELLGDVALENDLDARFTGMSHVANLVLDGLSEEDGAYLDRYAAGVNEYIRRVVAGEATQPSEIGLAATLLGTSDPGELMLPFDRSDIAAMVAVIMYQTNFETGDVSRNANAQRLDTLFDGAVNQDLRLAGARSDIWERLETPFPVASTGGWASTDGAQKSDESPLERFEKLNPAGLRKKTEARLLDRAADRLDAVQQRLKRKQSENWGSNTWAVAGDKAEDGAALVAGDGHLQLDVPGLMYQIGMNTTLFGGGDIHQAGLLITSLPLLAVGTNGKIAWSQVNPVSDITDWYREEITLGADGLPESSLFQGAQQPLVSHEETFEIADIPLLNSVGRTETVTRWTTFDGRYIFDIEGRELAIDEEPGADEAVVQLAGSRVVPGDVDGDGVVTAISFDYTAFDTTGYVSALQKFTEAQDVYEFQAATKGLIGNMLYSAVADDQGNILFTSYQAVPCRSYLERDDDGVWVPGADPTMLIDGTQYGGFTIPSDAEGLVDESQGAGDPYRCVVPFDETPQAVNPEQGYVLNANNQPAPITNDGTLHDDPWYIGGPWASVRADSINSELEKSVADNNASIEDMANIQAFNRSRLGEMFLGDFLDAVAAAKTASELDVELEPHQQRLADVYTADAARLEEATMRLSAWRDGGYATPTGVETFYSVPGEQDLEDAVATMIFNAWLPRAIGGTFDDEDMNAAWRYSSGRARFRALARFLAGRGEGNPGALASFDETTGESVFFDRLGTDAVERSDEILIRALVGALDFLASDPTGDAEGGFGTADMSQWLWGLRHQVRFESLLGAFLPPGSDFSFITDLFSITTSTLPLAQGLEATDPRKDLRWFPRPGDNYAVDAANPGFSGTRFTYGDGPVMRMVISIKDGQVRGQNIIPGGQSAITTSPFFADQAELWLGNETWPLRYHIADIAEGAVGREHYKPE